MSISFSEFISQMGTNPAFLITVILTLGVILVNGWTDAPERDRDLCFNQGFKAKARDPDGGRF